MDMHQHNTLINCVISVSDIAKGFLKEGRLEGSKRLGVLDFSGQRVQQYGGCSAKGLISLCQN